MVGDSREVLKSLPAQKFQCVVTSPPYWRLRDYGVEDQIGAEMQLENYIANLTEVFTEVRRVLKDDGVLWLNIGDSYTSGNRKYRAPDRKTDTKSNVRAMNYRPVTPEGLKPKELVGVPWRVAFALQNAGWYLRSDIIWYKPNCLPESMKDRPTKSHEYLFLLSKSENYYYDSKAIMEVSAAGKLRNKRTVWSVNTQAFPGAHFATFPPDLIIPSIKCSSRRNDFILDPFFGAGTVGVVCKMLGRRFVGIELCEEYARMAERRIKQPIKEDLEFNFFESESTQEI
jgi:DNA modification methylase